MRLRDRVDRWFWRVLGVRGTVIFNIGCLLVFVAIVVARCAGRHA